MTVAVYKSRTSKREKVDPCKKIALHGHRGDYAGNEYRNTVHNNIFDKEAKKSYSF